MHHFLTYLITGVVAVAILAAAAPAVIGIAKVLVPTVAVAGVVAGVLRIVWHLTTRH